MKPNKKSTEKNKSWTYAYRDIWSGQEWRKNKDQIVSMGLDLLAWIKKNPRAIKIEQWCAEYGIPRSSYYKFKDENPELAAHHENALMLLANRREEGMVYIDKGMRDRPLMWIHGKYDPDWRSEQKIQSELKIKENEAAKIDWSKTVIEIPAAEKTEEAHTKKAKDENRNPPPT